MHSSVACAGQAQLRAAGAVDSCVGRPTLQCAGENVHSRGETRPVHHLIYGSLDRLESALQTASRSVQQFLHSTIEITNYMHICRTQ